VASGDVSFPECRAAARAGAAAEFGRPVVNLLRPRTIGIVRTRAPLAFQLYLASLDGRLVWRGSDSFAMLRRPADRRVKGSGHGLLWFADHQWHLVVLVVQFVTVVVGVLTLVALRGVIGRGGVFAVAVSLELVLLVVILVDQLWMLGRLVWRGCRSLVGGRPSPGRVAAELLPNEHWSLVMFHQADPARADELLADVARRFTRLAPDDTTLVCLRDGVTTAPMREKVARWADGLTVFGDDPEVNLWFAGRPDAKPNRIVETGSFFFLYLGGVVGVILAMAFLVPGWERAACPGPGCEGHPVTFALAVRWLAQRLLWSDPPHLTPVTLRAWIIGMMVSGLTPISVGVAFLAGWQYARYRRSLAEPIREAFAIARQRSVVLMVVSTPVERAAVLAAVRAVTGKEPVRDSRGYPVFQLGTLGNSNVVLAQTGPGSTGPVSAGASVPELIAQWKADYVISTGICFGLRMGEQETGDIIVSRQLRLVGPRKVTETDDGRPAIRIRGDFVTAGHRLYNYFASADPPEGVQVHVGALLTWDVLVDLKSVRDELVTLDPEALGCEMEGAGVYTAAHRAGIDWIVVKGISDWGFHKTDEEQRKAATNAARFVVEVVRSSHLEGATA
jgi:nucleoside phosphorylase